MNNKGFAITGILYGVLLLFLMVLLSLLYVLVTRINRLTTLNEEVKNVVETKNEITTIENNPTDDKPYYITTMRGKYVININGNTTADCYAYLPKNILLKINENKLYYLLPNSEGELNVFNTENLQELSLIGCTNDGITNFSIKSIYS